MANAIQTSKSSSFQPTYNPQQALRMLRQYQSSPHRYSEQQKNMIEAHAHYYNIPFTREDTNPGIKTIITEAAKGYASGLTASVYHPAPAKNKVGEIAQSLGHLAGFAGMTGGAIAKALGASASTVRLLNKMRGTSAPMWVGGKAVKGTKKVAKALLGKGIKGKSDASAGALNFLRQGWVKDSVEGAVHLGAASAVSSWRGGIDEIMSGAMHGAKAGAIFRAMGNFISIGDPKGDKALMALAGSMYM